MQKMSAELGDWLLRCNGGEGMSEYAPALTPRLHLTRP